MALTAIRAGVIAALVSAAQGAFAAATVSDIALVAGPNGGTIGGLTIDNDGRTIDLTKTFTDVSALTLRVTVAHATGPGDPYEWTETITNNTGQAWTDYHISIVEPDPPNGVTFNAFQQSTLAGFTLDSPPDSGPRNLNYTGALAIGSSADASFMLSMPDPGEGNTYTFDLVQVPTVIPLPPAAWLMGSALVGLIVTKRRTN